MIRYAAIATEPISASAIPSGVLARSGAPTTIATPAIAPAMLSAAYASTRLRRITAYASVQTGVEQTSSVEIATEANFSDAIQAAKCSASSAPATTRLRSLRRSIRRNARRRPARRLVGTDGDRGARDAGDLRPPVTSAKRAKIAAAPIASGASATKATAPRWGFMRGAVALVALA